MTKITNQPNGIAVRPQLPSIDSARSNPGVVNEAKAAVQQIADKFHSVASALGPILRETARGSGVLSARGLGFEALDRKQPKPPTTPSTAVVGTNVNVSNEAGPQSETDIAIDPTNPDHLIGGSNSITNDGAMRVFESFDGGKTWTNQQLPLAPAPLNAFTSDPAVTFDKQGNAYYSFLGIDSQGQNTTLVNLVKPAGATEWGGMTTVPNVNADKQFMTSDTTDGPNAGNVYIAWDNNNADNSQQVRLATSSDGGKTWGTTQVNNQGTTVIGSDPKIGPNGEVYVAWANYKDHTININVSTDGGKTFSPTDSQIHKWTAPTGSGLDVKIPADPERGVTTFPSIDVDRSNGPNRGTVYCAYMDGSAKTGYHVYLQASKDGGKTWSDPKQVDDDATGKRHDHFMPRIAVDQSDGSVNIAWYDTRNDPANKQADVYYSRSTDGGQTFEANTRISSASSDETKSGPAGTIVTTKGHHEEDDGEEGPERTTNDVLVDANGYGDYIGIAADNGVVHAFWTDSRKGNQEEEVYTADIRHDSPTTPPPSATKPSEVA